MNKLLKQINRIPKQPFTFIDLKKISKLNSDGLKVTISRLVKNGDVIRLSKGLYTSDISKIDWERLAVEIYYPSYLSFEWVLAKYNVLSQKPVNLTLATSLQTKKIETAQKVLFYHHLQSKMFWGYKIKNGYLEANVEKAWLDLAYLSLNGYANFDVEEMNLSILNKKRIKQYLQKIKSKKLSKLIKTVLSK